MPNAHISNLTSTEAVGVGFDHPELLYGLVTDRGDGEYWDIDIHDLQFFGYLRDCENNMNEFPETVLVDKIKLRLKNDSK